MNAQTSLSPSYRQMREALDKANALYEQYQEHFVEVVDFLPIMDVATHWNQNRGCYLLQRTPVKRGIPKDTDQYTLFDLPETHAEVRSTLRTLLETMMPYTLGKCVYVAPVLEGLDTRTLTVEQAKELLHRFNRMRSPTTTIRLADRISQEELQALWRQGHGCHVVVHHAGNADRRSYELMGLIDADMDPERALSIHRNMRMYTETVLPWLKE